MIKIQIKSIWGDILFEYEKENNTIKDTLEEAVRQGANLNGANLYGANLYGATNIPYIPLACPSDGAHDGQIALKRRNSLPRIVDVSSFAGHLD